MVMRTETRLPGVLSTQRKLFLVIRDKKECEFHSFEESPLSGAVEAHISLESWRSKQQLLLHPFQTVLEKGNATSFQNRKYVPNVTYHILHHPICIELTFCIIQSV
jgi:hypothetical protein